jgi:hypothetical protein
VIEVLIDNIISWISLIFNLFIVSVVCIGDVITVSHIALGVLRDILSKMILVNFDGASINIIVSHLGGRLPSQISLSLRKFETIDEASITDDIIIVIIDILNFLIVGLVSIGETIRFSLQEYNSIWSFYSSKRFDFVS